MNARIPDEMIEHVWVPDSEMADPQDEATVDSEPVLVSPDFYEQNGTPVDEHGWDMRYSHTECKVFGRAIELLKIAANQLGRFLAAHDDKQAHPGMSTIADIEALLAEIERARA